MTVTSILERHRHEAHDDWGRPARLPHYGVPDLPAVYLRGDRITPADLATHFGFLDAGLVAAVRTDARGQRAIIETRGAGATIGEDSLIGFRALDADLYFEALVPTRVRWVDAGSLHAGATDVSKAVMAVMAARVRQQQETAYRNRLQSLAQRVAHQLVALSHETVLGTDAPALEHITRFDLARIVGSNRSGVSKLCSGFETRGWCRIVGKSISVTDEPALTAYASRGTDSIPGSLDDGSLPSERVLIDLALRPRSA